MQNQSQVEKGVEQNHVLQPQQGAPMQQQQQGIPMQQQPGMVMAQPGVIVGTPYYALHDNTETPAILLLICGFCVPCLWFVPVCLYGTKHPNRSTRILTIISLVLAIISAIFWVFYLVLVVIVADDVNNSRNRFGN